MLKLHIIYLLKSGGLSQKGSTVYTDHTPQWSMNRDYNFLERCFSERTPHCTDNTPHNKFIKIWGLSETRSTVHTDHTTHCSIDILQNLGVSLKLGPQCTLITLSTGKIFRGPFLRGQKNFRDKFFSGAEFF